jgi:hypothetical protein
MDNGAGLKTDDAAVEEESAAAAARQQRAAAVVVAGAGSLGGMAAAGGELRARRRVERRAGSGAGRVGDADFRDRDGRSWGRLAGAMERRQLVAAAGSQLDDSWPP